MKWCLLRLGITSRQEVELKNGFANVITALKRASFWADEFTFDGKTLPDDEFTFEWVKDRTSVEMNSNVPKLRLVMKGLIQDEMRFYLYVSQSFITNYPQNLLDAVVKVYEEVASNSNVGFTDWTGLEPRGMGNLPILFPPVDLVCFYPGYPITAYTKGTMLLHYRDTEEAHDLLITTPASLQPIERKKGSCRRYGDFQMDR